MRPHELTSDTLALLAVGCIGVACTWGPGFQLPAVALLMAAAVLCGAAFVAPRGEAGTPVWAVVVAVGAFSLRNTAGAPWAGLLAIGALLAVLPARRRGVAVCGVAVALVALVHTLVERWTWGREGIDVFGLTQTAAGALLHGHNPYGPTSPAYIQGVTYNHPLHFPYGPTVALLALPGRALGDVRASSLVMAALLFAVVLVLGRRRGMSAAQVTRLAALVVALPVTVVLVTSAWVEAYSVSLFALWLLLRPRRPTLAALVLGLCLATKPTIVLALVPFLLWSRSARREIAVAVVAAAVLVLPFALKTGVGQFYDDVVGVHLHLFPTRTDALTVNALLHFLGRPFAPSIAGILAVAALIVVVLRRRPRDCADLLLAGALLSIVSFLLAKEAFPNYYFAVAMLLVLAVVHRGVPVDSEGPRLPAQARMAWRTQSRSGAETTGQA